MWSVGNAGAPVLFGTAESLLWLFIGVLSAALLRTEMAYVTDVTTEEDRGKGMGWIYSGDASGDGLTLYTTSPGLM